jgi:hypothetical protein
MALVASSIAATGLSSTIISQTWDEAKRKSVENECCVEIQD